MASLLFNMSLPIQRGGHYFPQHQHAHNNWYGATRYGPDVSTRDAYEESAAGFVDYSANNNNNNAYFAAPAFVSAKPPKKSQQSDPLQSVFIKLFHKWMCRPHASRKTRPPHQHTLKQFVVMYMNEWEALMQPTTTREEKRLISDFKQFHRNMQREEWDQIVTHFIRFMNVNLSTPQEQSSSDKYPGFREFSRIVTEHFANAHSSSSSPCTSPSSSPSSGSLSGSLLTRSLLACTDTDSTPTTSNNSSTKSLPSDELLSLYICIYFPNYRELFDGQHIILTASLTNLLDNFVKQHPSLDSAVLSALLSAVDDYFTVTQSTHARSSQ